MVAHVIYFVESKQNVNRLTNVNNPAKLAPLILIVTGTHILRILIFMLSMFCSLAHSQQTAQNLFGQYRTALYQIKIIELESGNKSSIGSGFQIELHFFRRAFHIIDDVEYTFIAAKLRHQIIGGGF